MISKHFSLSRRIGQLGKRIVNNDNSIFWTTWQRNRILICPRFISSGSAMVRARGGVEDSLSLSHSGTSSIEEKSKPYRNRPFVKELFVGKFDTGVLIYPEFKTTEDLENLEIKVASVEKFFKEEVDSKLIESSGEVPSQMIDRLRELGLFGPMIPTEYGGLGLSAKEYARFSEVISLDGSISNLLTAHNDMAVQSILIAGSERQKLDYLPDLASGRRIAAYCLTEKDSGGDLASIKLRAQPSGDGTTYTLNGSKQWVTNAQIADLFVVYAKTQVEILREPTECLTAFLVDRNAEGITVREMDDMLGVKGSKLYQVDFENTQVPAESVLGEVDTGFQLGVSVLSAGRYFEGAALAGVIKKCIGLAAEHAIKTKRFNEPLAEFSLTKEKFGNIAVQMYAMETMAYLTAGIHDNYQNPDIAMESAIVKLFSQETARNCLHLCMEVFGATGYSTGQDLERHLRDAYTSSLLKGSGDILRLYIALLGAQYAGQEIADTIRKLNNPFHNVGYTFKRQLTKLGYSSKHPNLVHKLYDHVHPTLSFSAEDFETMLHQFSEIIEFCLSAYKEDLLHEQQTLMRLADIVVDLYAMTAVLARAGRSKSIGLRNADHEILLAQMFVNEARERVNHRLSLLRTGKYLNGDDHKKRLAETIFKSRGWAVDSPLVRNW